MEKQLQNSQLTIFQLQLSESGWQTDNNLGYTKKEGEKNLYTCIDMPMY